MNLHIIATMSLADWIQLAISFIALFGVLAALLTAYLTWRSRAILLATKEKHSDDLKTILDQMKTDLTYRHTAITPIYPYTPPTEQAEFEIERVILFDDLKNHIPRELDLLKSWTKFKQKWLELQKQEVHLQESVKQHLEQYGRLPVLPVEQVHNQHSGITYHCVSFLSSHIVDVAAGRFTPVNFVIPHDTPNQLYAGGLVAESSSSGIIQLKGSLETMVDNIEKHNAGTSEHRLLAEAEKIVGYQTDIESLRLKLQAKIDEAKVIPILAGNCRHLRRATEPLFFWQKR